MKVSIIDIDSTIPNLALKKVEKYYLDKNAEIEWNNPIGIDMADETFVSCVFDWNKRLAAEYEGRRNVYIGGSGYSKTITLPPEIDAVKPRINYGFTTRGCIRHCYFCIVPEKEGTVRIVGDIYDIWDGKSKELIIMDNNILALPDHFKTIAGQIIKENIKVDFNQGLDYRLLNDEIIKILFSLRHIREIRFSFDDIKYKPSVIKQLELMKIHGLKNHQTRWYIYVGENDTFETVYERLMLLREYKQNAYVMRDRKIYNKPEYVALSAWANHKGAFGYELADVLKTSRLKMYKPHFDKWLNKDQNKNEGVTNEKEDFELFRD